MKIHKYIILFFVLITAYACENEQVVNISEIYQEKIVVRAELVKDSLFAGVTITKSLPLNSGYDINKAKLQNFTGYLKINNIEIVPLHHTKDGIYKPLHPLTINGNTKYELIANADGKQIYAQTFVPDTVFIRSVYYKDRKFLEARITPNSNYVYGAIWALYSNDVQKKSDDFYNISQSVGNLSEITVQTKEFPENLYNNSLMAIQVYTFEKSFIEYFKTKINSQSISNSFGQGGGPVTWNVKGENVIGIFIGYTKSQFTRP